MSVFQCHRGAYTDKSVVYDALSKAASETLLTIGADPKHLGAKIGVTMVLHSWGSALAHHPHVHCIVPGGGLSPDGQRWISCRPDFLLPVRVLSRLFRRLMIERLAAAHTQGALQFFGGHAALHDADAFRAFLKPLRRINGPILPRPQRSNLHNAKLHPASQALSFLGRPSLSLPTRPRSTGVPET